jgi:hypothetical protein
LRLPGDGAFARYSATIGTLFDGLLLGYGVLFAMVLLAVALVVPAGLLESTPRHPAGFADYVTVAWLISSTGDRRRSHRLRPRKRRRRAQHDQALSRRQHDNA